MRTARGFTIIELMIVLVILSILAGISVAGYQSTRCKMSGKSVEQCKQELGDHRTPAESKKKPERKRGSEYTIIP